jgi:transposase
MKQKNKNKIIRTSRHNLSYSNIAKSTNLNNFINEYTNAVRIYTDYIWNNDIHWTSTHKHEDEDIILHHLFSLEKESYECSSFLDYKIITFSTKLSARALSSAITQACGIIKAHSNKLQKMLNKLNWLTQTGKSEKSIEKYKERIHNIKKTESIELKNIYPELSSKCCEFISDNRHFNGWIHLKSIGEEFGHIYLPVNFHKHSNKLMNSFDMMTSFLIYPTYVDIRWEKPVIMRKSGITVGADPGINRLCSFSHIENQDSDDYKNCLNKISKKRKNSNSYKKAIKYRKIIVNNFINNIDLSDVKEINFEDNSTIHHKNYKGRFLSHYAYAEIKQKIETIAIENGVRFQLQGNVYKSQRCSNCGWTQKSNRDNTLFICKHCGLTIDADFNASINQTHKLAAIPSGLRVLNLGKLGFFWKPQGLFSLDDQELRIPDSSLL